MLSSVIHKISNYFFVRFETYIANKRKNELEKIISEFKSIGLKLNIGKDYSILNPKYIEIGDNFSAKERFRIEAWDKFHDQLFSPNIKIGNNVIFNTDIHIGCINSIVIGDNCLFASRIYITDHDHGDTTAQILNTAPSLRPLQTKGPVIIEDNVWVGEGVAILAGVKIGKNSIIATNAVVTKDVPPNAVVAGIPAKVIKIMSND